ncbi:uncharacterized protein [Diadema setosum]|uniref:uncharacterized protein n=1 Tax=Diadema setosum TaxID=31175 RepID=UPI003B3A32EE
MVVDGNMTIDDARFKEQVIPIETLPNLRRVDMAGKLYRSSRQDLLSRSDSRRLSELGIRTIIDFRSKAEYKFARGEKIFDQNSEILEVIIPKGRKFMQNVKDVPVKPVELNKPPPKAIQNGAGGHGHESVIEQQEVAAPARRRYLINFFKLNYVATVFMRIPIYKRLLSVLYLIVDVLFRTHYRYFVSFFAKECLNPAGLLANYIDMLELSGPQICLALRILSDPGNLPALVSCAHGKDRTGILVAMVLSLMGKSEEYISSEYALSEVGLNPIRSRVYKEIVERTSMDESFTHAKRETMEGMLRYIQESYGSVPDYLESIGFSRAEQARLLKSFEE